MPEFDLLYAAEKLSDGIRELMLPHPRGEDYSLAVAMGTIARGVPEDADLGDSDANRWRDTLYRIMDTSNVAIETEEEAERGALWLRAEELTTDQKDDFATAAVSLEYHFQESIRQ